MPGSRERKPGNASPLVGILGGSKTDLPVLEKTAEVLTHLGVPSELLVLSAHRTPDRLFQYAEQAADRGIEVIVAGAGGAAALPGVVAAKTHLPVIGVPIPTEHLRGLDSLLSMVQMPRGMPVATVAIRSEEHTSELQSHSDLVCRLLLEKKKQKIHEPEVPATTNRTSDRISQT